LEERGGMRPGRNGAKQISCGLNLGALLSLKPASVLCHEFGRQLLGEQSFA
jgi:hypothetical protein